MSALLTSLASLTSRTSLTSRNMFFRMKDRTFVNKSLSLQSFELQTTHALSHSRTNTSYCEVWFLDVCSTVQAVSPL